jgi:hypothetical protein
MPITNNYFDSKRDREICEAGGFFCRTCLVGKPADDASPDERHCQQCYDFLAREMEQDTSHRHADWHPRIPQGAMRETSEPLKKPSQQLPDKQRAVTKPQPVEDMVRAYVTSSVTDDVTAQIKILAGQGMSSRAIARLLQSEGIAISHMTIARRLQGVLV